MLDATTELEAERGRRGRGAPRRRRGTTSSADQLRAATCAELRDAAAHLEIERQSAEREHGEVARTHLDPRWRTERCRRRPARRTRAGRRERRRRRAGRRARGRRAGARSAEKCSGCRRGPAMRKRGAPAAGAGRGGLARRSTASVEALERLERERVGLAPAAARLLAARAQFGDGAVLGPLSDFLTAGAADAAAVERFLGRDRARRRGARSRGRRRRAAWHAKNDPGPLCLLPLDATALARRAGEPRATTGRSLASRVAPADSVRALGRARCLDVCAISGPDAAFEDARGAIWLPGRRRAAVRCGVARS